MASASSLGLYIQHALILIGGVLLGLVGAYLAGDIPFDVSAEIARARELGIVSRTTLNGYAKSLDLLNYLFVLGLPILCALIPWFVWSRRRQPELLELLGEPDPAPRSLRGMRNLLPFLLVAAAALFITFNIDNFYRPAFNPYVGAWIFLGEEGEMLEWAHRTLNGDVYGRDYFCLYGPMLVYPLAWVLELFGESVVVARVFAHVLNLIGFGIAVLFLYKTTHSRWTFVISALVYLVVFNITSAFAVKSSILRFLLGILPLLLLHLHGYQRSRMTLIMAGAFAGQSLLFSQEAGICCVAAAAFIVLADLRVDQDRQRVLRDGLVFFASVALSITPFLAYFALNDALLPFLESIYGYPRLATLGFGALAFPSFGDFLASPLKGGALLHYWVIAVYIVSLLECVPLLILGKMDRRTRLKLMLAVFGILLFRVALARSSESTVLKVAHPAFLLCFLHIDSALQLMRSSSVFHIRIGNAMKLGAWGMSLALLFTYSPWLRAKIEIERNELSKPFQKFVLSASGTLVPQIERSGVFVDAATADSLIDIEIFINTLTRTGDFVYFFPNEPIYYFLFNRRNPTRYSMSYFAITTEQRLELVRDLEKKKPRYVVYSTSTWRVDDIPEFTQVPEVVNYIRENYHAASRLRGVVILERNSL